MKIKNHEYSYFFKKDVHQFLPYQGVVQLIVLVCTVYTVHFNVQPYTTQFYIQTNSIYAL